MNLPSIQEELRRQGIDAWLFYDHHHRDPIAYRVLGLPDGTMVTRRWYYVIPAQGEPAKLTHRIEPHHLTSLPGKEEKYSAWQELFEKLKTMLAPYKNVAMQYSPDNLVFLVSMVDAGTVDLVRSFGKKVVSSGDLVARFEATWTEDQVRSHFEARDAIDSIVTAFWPELGRRARQSGTSEYEMQQWLMEAFRREHIVAGDPPNVSVGAHSGDPHYEPSAERSADIKAGDFILLDIWGKKDRPNAVYYDITWTGVIAPAPSDRQREIFEIVRDARDAGINAVKSAVSSGRKLQGWEVDKATRDHIASRGYGQYFIHRTGHSIGTEVHANGANMDNLEVHDERQVLANSCFSIEPGIYFPEWGVRTEINMLVRERSAEVTGKIQNEIVTI